MARKAAAMAAAMTAAIAFGQFRIAHTRVGDFEQGEIVEASDFGEGIDIQRMLDVGAIVRHRDDDEADVAAATLAEAGSDGLGLLPDAHLRSLAKGYGVAGAERLNKEQMIAAIRSIAGEADTDKEDGVNVTTLDSGKATSANPPEPASATETAPPPPPPPSDEPGGDEGPTVSELRRMAREAQIVGASRMNRADLIAALEAQGAETGDSTGTDTAAAPSDSE